MGFASLLGQRRHRHSAYHERVLGTSLELQISSVDKRSGPLAEKAALAEIDQLEAIFNAYNPQSELSRWQSTRNLEVPVSLELAQVLADAEIWRQKSSGAFNPAVEALTRVWTQHARENKEVKPDVLAPALEQMKGPLWNADVIRQTACRLTDLPVTLNAIAKGFIIDRAAHCASQVEGVRQVLVNIGGDLCHIGDKPLGAAIADPFADAENAIPVDTVRICNQGMATSGNYRRGFRIGERWYSHVIDPSTGYHVEQIVSVSVVAPDAQTADVLATAGCVLSPEATIALADSLENIGVLLVDADRMTLSNTFWKRHSINHVE